MNSQRIMDHLMALCEVASITGSVEEAMMPKVIVERLKMIPYFKKHDEDIFLYELEQGGYVFALKRSIQQTAKTIVLLSHFDVVDVEEFGIGKPYAFDPVAYTKFLKQNKIHLDDEARHDLDHGYLFGRGVCDMKWGIATDLELMHYFSEHEDEQEANILFVSVPDEERNSKGMCEAVKTLSTFRQQHQLDLCACVVGEPDISFEKSSKYKQIFVGSAGKIMPLFYCVGKETHVGDPFDGLNPNLLNSMITLDLELNDELIDQYEGYQTSAPICLKQSDLKGTYSVQTPYDAWSYFNIMTLTSTPSQILNKLTILANTAFEKVLIDRRQKYKHACEKRNKQLSFVDFKVNVMTFQELYEECSLNHGISFDQHMEDFKENLECSDLREMTLSIIQEVQRFSKNRDPKIIIALAPPYYPHTGFISKSTPLIRSCEKLIDIAKEMDEVIHINYSFNGLSDMSYLSLRGEIVIEELMSNFPLWGDHYQVPLHEIKELNIPFVNFGPLGKDPHKYSERVDYEYSFCKAPTLFLTLIKELSNRDELPKYCKNGLPE